MSQPILEAVASYYSSRLKEAGPGPNGVDWKDEAAQRVRFQRLLTVVDPALPHPRIVEFGCGYGALWNHMADQGLAAEYEGIDISEEMVLAARELHQGSGGPSFTLGSTPQAPGDYCLASGLFNVRLDIAEEDWKQHVLSVIAELDRFSTRGFAFNCLTSYSDADKRSPKLYYGDPCFYFDLCKRNYGFNVALLHDYGMYDFTITVRKG